VRPGLLPPPGPARVLVVAGFLASVGTGVQLAGGVLFFTGPVGLSAGELAAGLTVAAVAGLLAGVPLGAVADRHGARPVLLAVVPAQAAAVLGYLLVSSVDTLAAVLAVAAALETGSSAARGGLVGTLFRGDRRVVERARLRAATNLGVGAGSVLTGLALLAGRRAAYAVLFAGAAAVLLAAALVLRRLPRTPPPPPAAGPRGPGVLADRRFLAVLAVQAVLFLDYGMLEVAIPLWVTGHTGAPAVLVAVIFVLNTAGIAVGQVRASRGTGDVAGAGRRAARAGLTLAAACLLVAAAGGRSAGPAAALLLAGALAHLAGEMWQSAASWGLAYGLAPDGAHGRYQGALSGAVSVAGLTAPILLVHLVVERGVAGWVGLAVAFAVAGGITGPAARWAAARRPAVR
jgi:MFS family permease